MKEVIEITKDIVEKNMIEIIILYLKENLKMENIIMEKNIIIIKV